MKKDQPKSEAQNFLDEYNKLCKKMGHRLVFTPAFRRLQTGGFEIVGQIAVGKIANTK